MLCRRLKNWLLRKHPVILVVMGHNVLRSLQILGDQTEASLRKAVVGTAFTVLVMMLATWAEEGQHVVASKSTCRLWILSEKTKDILKLAAVPLNTSKRGDVAF